MMKLLPVLLMIASMLFPVQFARGESSFSAYARVDTAMVKPGSYPIADPLAEGPLRVLFIGPGETTGFVCRETVARLECSYDVVLTAGRERLGYLELPAGDEALGEDTVAKRLQSLLAREWDAVWLDFHFKSLPGPLQDALKRQIERGAGLVYGGTARDLRSLGGKGKLHRDLLRAVESPHGSIEFAGNLAKGRMLAISQPSGEIDARGVGDFCTRMVHALIIASRREGDIVITGLERPGKRVEHESVAIMSYRLDFIHSGPEAPRMVRSRYRDSNGSVVAQLDDTYLLKKGKGFVRVGYPFLPVGDYSIDISILDAGKVTAVGWTSIRVESEDGLAEMDVQNRLVRSGEFIVGRVRTSREVQEGMGLRIELADSRGRRLDITDIEPTPRHVGTGFALKANSRAGGYATVRADLFKNNGLIHRLETPLVISGERGGTFRLSGIEDSERSIFSFSGYRALAESGVQRLMADMAGLTPGNAVQKVMQIFSAGFEAVPSFTLKTGMDVSVSDASDISAIAVVADSLRKAGLRTYMLRIDPVQPEAEALYSPEALASLRSFLGKRYGKIENLNAAWGSAFPGFDQVKPMDGGNGAVRIDRFLHAREWERQRIGAASRAIARSDSTMEIILARNTGRERPGTMRISGDTGESATQKDNRLSFADEADGYDLMGPQGMETARYMPWESLFAGSEGLWWRGLAGRPGSALVPGYGVHPVFASLAAECREISRGVDRLLRGANRVYDPVAILDIAGVLPPEGRGTVLSSIEIFRTLCFDTGFLPRILPLDSLRKDVLDSLGIRALILPGVKEIDPVSAAVIGEFVRDGGGVIADIRPAVTGEGENRAVGTLFDTVFPAPGFAEHRNDAQRGSYSPRALLGFGIMDYQSARNNARGASLRRYLKDTLASAGVKPRLMADPDHVAWGSYAVFERDSALFIGYLPDSMLSGVGTHSGVSMPEVSLNRFHAFDLREERYLGMLPGAAQNVSGARPTVIAMLPYRVQNVEFDLDKTVVRPGETVVARCSIRGQDPQTEIGRHVFDVRVLRPDGSEDFGYGGVYENENGRLQFNLAFVESDPLGKWTVRVRDVATGKSAEKNLIVMSRVGFF